MRRFLMFVVALSVCGVLWAENVTLPAVASIVGEAPFFSDVRAFNTSYTDSLAVTAVYHCFIPTPCTAGAPQLQFTLAPREARAFNDMVADAFQAPGTAGGVEFAHSGGSGQLVVTSRLFSTAPVPTVGMFIPGLMDSEAHATTVLTSIQNGGAGKGFRTNVGVYNRGDSAVNVTFTIFDAGQNQVGNPVTGTVPGHSGLQVNEIFTAADAASQSTDNAAIVVSSSGEVFSYAAVIDNNTTDPIFVVGALDEPQQQITPVATATPTQPAATATPTRPAATATPTPTPTPPVGPYIVNVGQGGLRFVDQVSGNSTTTIPVGSEVSWVWVAGMPHTTTSTTPGIWDSGIHSAPFTFNHTFSQAGTFSYFCQVHGTIMSGTVIVNP